MTTFTESTITFPYQRSLGPILGAFMTALTERRILGIRAGESVLVPPSEWDPATGESLGLDLVEVGPAGTVEAWTWVPSPTVQHPLDRPFAFAFIRLDGATNPILHAVDTGTRTGLSVGMRVAPRWKGKRIGHITDLACFIPGEASEIDGPDAGPATEPVTVMEYRASITYQNPVPAMLERGRAATREHRLTGMRCPVCDRIYIGGDRPQCPIDSVELGPETIVDLPQTGTITNFVVVTPVQYPGQTQVERFARVFVLLDDTDVIFPYQPVIELPVDDVRVGVRVSAVWASPGEAEETVSGTGRPQGGLVGWIPNGEPDIDDPDLVNRVY